MHTDERSADELSEVNKTGPGRRLIVCRLCATSSRNVTAGKRRPNRRCQFRTSGSCLTSFLNNCLQHELSFLVEQWVLTPGAHR